MVGEGWRTPYDRVDHAEDGQMATKIRRFRELFDADEILAQPGICDGFSSRLVEQMGLQTTASVALAGEARLMMAAATRGMKNASGTEGRAIAQRDAKYGTAR
jgi:2-methylisocitrate lyase-like PEP mutase family enzyme